MWRNVRTIICGLIALAGVAGIGYELILATSPRLIVMGPALVALWFPIFNRLSGEGDK